MNPATTLHSNSAAQAVSQATPRTEFNLTSAFHRHSTTQPDALALSVAGTRFSYGELAGLARRVSGWLGPFEPDSAKIGVLASRSVEAYAGILGALWSGAAYVPINPKTPEERLLHILRITQLDALIVDPAGADRPSERVLEHAPRRVLSGAASPTLLDSAKNAAVTVESFVQLPNTGPDQPVNVASDALAYLLFTSGTTGVPKGVMVTAGCVGQMIDFLQHRYEFLPEDRVSQAFELTFDLSVFDMFMTWSAGASLHVVPEPQLMAPGKFIRENQLTVWFCVPSAVAFMQRMRMLSPDEFPHLRCSLFCGEPLPLSSAQTWATAAPNSIVENLYGPTEATVACLLQRLGVAIYGNQVVACCRMSGFYILRNAYRPLQSQTIAEFWNRYYYYFKELLGEIFFFPTYMRYFKKYRRLRTLAATIAAAKIGNMIYHFCRDFHYVADMGLAAAVSGFQVYAFYSLILGVGIGQSQMRMRRAVPAREASAGRRFLASFVVITFFCLLEVFDYEPRSHTLGTHVTFFLNLFSLHM